MGRSGFLQNPLEGELDMLEVWFELGPDVAWQGCQELVWCRHFSAPASTGRPSARYVFWLTYGLANSNRNASKLFRATIRSRGGHRLRLGLSGRMRLLEAAKPAPPFHTTRFVQQFSPCARTPATQGFRI
jgi:hypothetical protein